MSDTLTTTLATPDNSLRRKRLFAALGGVIALSAIGYGLYWHFHASRFISTDNAYTAAEVAQVTPSVGGTVAAVKVVDTQSVKQGDVLVVIDDTDARLALAQAEAELGRAVRRVKGYVANDNGLSAQIQARDADERRAAAQLVAAESDFERAEIDLKRREALAGSGSVSGEELTRAQNAFATAKANLDVARAAAAQARANRAAALGSREANAVLIENADLDSNPEVALARARRDQARVDLERTVVRAPVDGVIARRQVQVGQRIQAGAPLLNVVPVQQMHVDANFKEVQLDRVQVGQAVELHSDRYGSDVVYHGVVEGISGGTGAAFATIPAQNATGNWIKVVQRLPVRVRLKAEELAERPLQVGLSMIATIDTRH
ncbi:HlyD family efflux transporter periplasmic adaptor subunit [Niveibacterium microcysteis]|uniref:HlyD family efflux transporter periplasmic adaptor subunit n=1 Tax=Niveibacterium microcysteis TaxID=2811415 RepID=A0ABX7M5I5_9RHOO|nr:HlyD family efflux transporter periplasmic adaptor subunit [Niveibacterium microcysteis]QSI75715.1 HlyD family efflux transporter periplasmic adaptor subunit [Niveibacterium microcysteis]